MTILQKLLLRLSEVRSRLNEIAGLEGDAFTDEIRTEAATLQTEFADLEVRHRAAIVSEGKPEITSNNGEDTEMRERIQLRSKARLTNFLTAALAGRQVAGAEAELSAAAGVSGAIPLELWDIEKPPIEQRVDAVSGSPSTAGLNVAPTIPQFSQIRLPLVWVLKCRV